MKAIFLKEIRSFFGSAIAYLVIAVFLVLAGLFTFVFEGDYNVLNSGYADFTPFFNLCPWILMFLVPAVTMKSFSDEFRIGTFASTLSDNQIVSFIVGLLICFFMYFGFESLATYFGTFASTIEKIGMSAHFSSMSRGVIDSRDLIYFISIALLFSVLTLFRLQAKIK